MPMNPLPPTGGPSAAPATPAAPGIKEENAATDSAFTGMLLALIGAQLVPAAPLPDQQIPGAEATAANAPAAVPPATAPVVARLPEEIETLLQAQRVTAAAAAPAAAEVDPVPAAAKAPEGVWVVEPLAAAAVPVTLPAEVPVRKEAEQPEGQPVFEAPVAVHAATAQPVHTAAAATTEAPAAPLPIRSPIEPDRLMEAVAKSAVNAGDGRYTVTLRLHPEHLGEVRLQLHVAGREVQTVLQVSNPDARQFLEQRGDQLRESLTQSGLTLSGFHVGTGAGERDRGAQQAFDEQPFRRRNRQSAAPITGVVAQPLRLPTTRRTSRFDTLA